MKYDIPLRERQNLYKLESGLDLIFLLIIYYCNFYNVKPLCFVDQKLENKKQNYLCTEKNYKI